MVKWNFDNMNRPIYGKLLNDIWATGEILENVGFKQSKYKLYIFSFRFNLNGSRMILWASLGGTSIIPLWEDNRVYLSWKSDFEDWKTRQIIIRCRKKLSELGVETRISFFEKHEPDGLFFGDKIENGFCNKCGIILNNEAVYCNECKIKAYEETKYRCAACLDLFDFNEIIIHHTSYIPEVTIHVCKSCHQKIHKSKMYKELYPKDLENRLNNSKL